MKDEYDVIMEVYGPEMVELIGQYECHWQDEMQLWCKEVQDVLVDKTRELHKPGCNCPLDGVSPQVAIQAVANTILHILYEESSLERPATWWPQHYAPTRFALEVVAQHPQLPVFVQQEKERAAKWRKRYQAHLDAIKRGEKPGEFAAAKEAYARDVEKYPNASLGELQSQDMWDWLREDQYLPFIPGDPTNVWANE